MPLTPLVTRSLGGIPNHPQSFRRRVLLAQKSVSLTFSRFIQVIDTLRSEHNAYTLLFTVPDHEGVRDTFVATEQTRVFYLRFLVSN